MTPEELKEFWNCNPLSWIQLTGGEIFLRNDLDLIFQDLGRRTSWDVLDFPTTGQTPEKILKVTPYLFEKRKDARVLVTISIDGPEMKHDELRNVPGAFQKAIQTAKGLRALEKQFPRLKVFLGFTLAAANIGDVDQMLSEVDAHGFGIDRVHLNIAQHSSSYYQNEHVDLPRTQDMIPVIRKFREARGRWHAVDLLERAYLTLAEEFIVTGKTPIPCAAGKASVFVEPQGGVRLCLTDSFFVGNLRDHGFRLLPLLQSEKAKEYLLRVDQGRCAQCWTPCEAYQSILTRVSVMGLAKMYSDQL